MTDADLARGGDAMLMSSPTKDERTALLEHYTEKIWSDVYGQKYGKKKEAELKAKPWVKALIKRAESEDKGGVACKRYGKVMNGLDAVNGVQLIQTGPEKTVKYLSDVGVIDEEDDDDSVEQAMKKFLLTQQEGFKMACHAFEAQFDVYKANKIDKFMKTWCDDAKDSSVLYVCILTCLVL